MKRYNIERKLNTTKFNDYEQHLVGHDYLKIYHQD